MKLECNEKKGEEKGKGEQKHSRCYHIKMCFVFFMPVQALTKTWFLKPMGE